MAHIGDGRVGKQQLLGRKGRAQALRAIHPRAENVT
jgi:hypothetical protein